MPESTWRRYQRVSCREKTLLEEQWRKAKEARLVHVATYDEEVSLEALVQRFDWPRHVIVRVLREAGLNTDRRDDFGSEWNRRHRRRRTG